MDATFFIYRIFPRQGRILKMFLFIVPNTFANIHGCRIWPTKKMTRPINKYKTLQKIRCASFLKKSLTLFLKSYIMQVSSRLTPDTTLYLRWGLFGVAHRFFLSFFISHLFKRVFVLRKYFSWIGLLFNVLRKVFFSTPLYFGKSGYFQ